MNFTGICGRSQGVVGLALSATVDSLWNLSWRYRASEGHWYLRRSTERGRCGSGESTVCCNELRESSCRLRKGNVS